MQCAHNRVLPRNFLALQSAFGEAGVHARTLPGCAKVDEWEFHSTTVGFYSKTSTGAALRSVSITRHKVLALITARVTLRTCVPAGTMLQFSGRAYMNISERISCGSRRTNARRVLCLSI
ncbi:uncharacterized protein SCHCODRAFT_02198304 [Schizophyllum commune H4-8]|uniref:uncharacterized protein n=1 Tax=Schizophyllum commune (strain H4-8 / FGSC 9210) TaxID=578458 RepID=UPI00215E858D|nr:uncharacterized protein SCHCODRAFT_02198304 [Schizophyllum commune H4-8]KAI5896761.1 hypothetical protein SCHCODRAFT_02198304 [Schizophyllum commune H4-8]